MYVMHFSSDQETSEDNQLNTLQEEIAGSSSSAKEIVMVNIPSSSTCFNPNSLKDAFTRVISNKGKFIVIF